MNPADKAAKLLALARDPAATPGEADTARKLADQICKKFGVKPAGLSQGQDNSRRALTGNVSPSWRPVPVWPPTEWPILFRIEPESTLHGISTEQARQMALEIYNALQSGLCYLDLNEEMLVQNAFDGLLNEYGKILLMGIHAVVI